jgi:hypothetical protein
MKKILVIALSLLALNVSAQSIKRFYKVEIDTIQHINWNPALTIDQAVAQGAVQYPYFWTDKVVWEYDLVKMTATWIGGPNQKVYKIRSAAIIRGDLTFAVGDETQVGWIDRFKTLPDGSTLLTSENVTLVDGLKDGSFTKGAKVVSR